MTTHLLSTDGHVGHGRSALFCALTGPEPDRWAGQRRRGLTVELGLAWITLPSRRDVAFVDVAGHERLLGNMVTGLGPVSAVCFVAAADPGWSSQSSDHRDAVDTFEWIRGCGSGCGRRSSLPTRRSMTLPDSASTFWMRWCCWPPASGARSRFSVATLR
jgi:translation initiation factor 2 gamma subunit (eIF-2gamma)